MTRYTKALILILACFAVLVPFTSTAPDGLERVAETLGVRVQEHEPLWKGLMPGYGLPAIGNSHVSTVLSGTLGALLVFSVAFFVGRAMSKPKNKDAGKSTEEFCKKLKDEERSK